MAGETDLIEVLNKLKVTCDNVEYGFVSVQEAQFKFEPGMLGTFKEDKGVTIIATKDYFKKVGLEPEALFAKLTVEVETSLQLVGLTAILATKLADNQISANVIAAYFHDHIFVQYELRNKALEVLNVKKNETSES